MCGMKLLIHSQTSTVPPMKFGNVWVIPSHASQGLWLLIHAEIKTMLVKGATGSGDSAGFHIMVRLVS